MSAETILDDWLEEETPDTFERIIRRPDLLGGKPCVVGTRLSVQFILERLAAGQGIDEITRTFPSLEPGDVKQAILFAASRMTAKAFAE